jgi:serine/threonine protein phosphatase PrpC
MFQNNSNATVVKIGNNYHFVQRDRGSNSNINNNPITHNKVNSSYPNHTSHRLNNNPPNTGTGNTIFNLNLNNTNNKFFSNVNPSTTMNQQERVINFGQDSNENSFKKNLRKPAVSNLIQNTSYNIITGAPFVSNASTYNSKFPPVTNRNGYGNYTANTTNANANGNSTLNKTEKNDRDRIDDLFYSFKNPPIGSNSNTINTTISNSNTNKNDNTLLTGTLSPRNNQNTISTTNPYSYSLNNKNTNTVKSSLSTPNNNSNSEAYINSASSVKEYAYKEDQNVRSRETMEDVMKVVDKFNMNSDSGLFTLYDGHGGDEVALLAKQRVPEIFANLMNNSNKTKSDTNYIENLLTQTFNKVDDEIKMKDLENMGCTASVVYITKEKDIVGPRRVVYSANVGDSRVVLVSNLGAKRLSYDHKASDYSEAARVHNSGGIIFGGRVFGSLILSRALGDFALKKYGVICTPHINKHFITDRDKYVIVASDGVWDVITDEDMYRLHLTVSNSEEFVRLIVKTAMNRGSLDNISCIVIKLN